MHPNLFPAFKLFAFIWQTVQSNLKNSAFSLSFSLWQPHPLLDEPSREERFLFPSYGPNTPNRHRRPKSSAASPNGDWKLTAGNISKKIVVRKQHSPHFHPSFASVKPLLIRNMSDNSCTTLAKSTLADSGPSSLVCSGSQFSGRDFTSSPTCRHSNVKKKKNHYHHHILHYCSPKGL